MQRQRIEKAPLSLNVPWKGIVTSSSDSVRAQRTVSVEPASVEFYLSPYPLDFGLSDQSLFGILKTLDSEDVLELVQRSVRNSDSMEEFVKYMLEELDTVRAFDEATSSPEETIPFEQAMEEIAQSRR